MNQLNAKPMDHIVYLDRNAKELDNLINGTKTMLIRGAMGRKLPYDRVNTADVLYFIENKGDGLIKAKALVEHVTQTDKLSKEESVALVEQNQNQLLLNAALLKRFSGKRYLILITLRDFEVLEPFKIDRSAYSNMDDWLPVTAVDSVKLK